VTTLQRCSGPLTVLTNHLDLHSRHDFALDEVCAMITLFGGYGSDTHQASLGTVEERDDYLAPALRVHKRKLFANDKVPVYTS
jgi:hypothetical protein